MDFKVLLTDFSTRINNSLLKLEEELSKVRTGKANPSLFSEIYVEAYGTKLQINQIATVSCPDYKTVIIKPFDKESLNSIIKAIQEANMGFNPLTEENHIRISIPSLTEERRLELAKKCKSIGEQFKITIRNLRKEANDLLKADKTISEDDIKTSETKIQNLTDSKISEIDRIIEKKQIELKKV